MAPDLSVIVVNHDTREHLSTCLASVPAAAGGLATQIVVVDNASSDGSASAVREGYPRAEVLAQERNLGFARACNLAVRRASAPFLAFLNPDVVCARNCLRRLVEELQSSPEIAVAGPRLAHGDGSLQTSAYRFPTLASEVASILGASSWLPVKRLRDRPTLRRWMPASGHFDPHEESRTVDFVTGACMVVRRSAFREVGGFDERFFLYYEEIDLCRRLRARGWETRHVPDAEATHHLNRSGIQRPRLAYLARQQSRLLYHGKHSPRAHRVVVRTTLGAAALGGLVGRALTRGHDGSPAVPEFVRVMRWCARSASIGPGAAGLAGVLRSQDLAGE